METAEVYNTHTLKYLSAFFIKGAELGPRPDVSRGPPLDRWEEFLDPEGRVTNPERVKELVFRGVRPWPTSSIGTATCAFSPRSSCRSQGVAPPLRKEVWKFLLGFYPWSSTATEREDILRRKTLVL